MHDIVVHDRVAFDLKEKRRFRVDTKRSCSTTEMTVVTIFQSFNLETYLMAFTMNVRRQYFVITCKVCIKS